MNDFSKKTVKALASKGIVIYGLTVIPDMTKEMPFACGERGYKVNDNGCARVWTYAQVISAGAI